MKFIVPIAILAAWAASSFAQSCSGGSFSQNVRERHVTRTHVFARGGCSGHVASAGCVGHVALVPQTVLVPKTVWAVAPVAPAAPVQAKPMPVANGPLVYSAPLFQQTCEPPLAGARERARAILKLPLAVAVRLKEALVAILPSREVHRSRQVDRIK